MAYSYSYAQKDIAMQSGPAKTSAGQKPDTTRVHELIATARTYFQTNIDSVFLYADQALKLSEQLKYEFGIGDAKLTLASYHRNKGNNIESMEIGLDALKIFERLNDEKKIASCCLQLAQIYKAIGGEKLTEVYIKQGIAYATRAYAINSQLRDTGEMASTLNITGIIYRDWGKIKEFAFYYDTAFACYTKAVELIQISGQGTDNLGKLYNNMSQVYMEYKKDYKAALDYLFKAVEFNTQRNNISSLTFNYNSISDTYRRMGDNKHAIQYALKMLELTEQLKAPIRLSNAYSQLARSYNSNKQYDSALHYYMLHTRLNDSMLNIEKAQQIADMQTKYETVKKESEIDRLSSENDNKNRQIAILIGGLAIFIVLAGSMIWLYRRVAHQKQLISQQSKQMETMMKELHHRVKNNLQIVSSLLSLQTYKLNDEGAKAAITQSQQRVQAMSFIHQRLYKTEELTSVNLKEYITDLVESLLSSYGYNRNNFDLSITVQKELLDVDKALPIGLIVNEIVTNAFKYAYKNVDRPSLAVSCSESGNNIVLCIKDNGHSWDETKWKQSNGSFGSQLVTTLCRQLRAKQALAIDAGTNFSFTIPQKAQSA